MSKRKKQRARVNRDEQSVEISSPITFWDRIKFVIGIALGIYALSYLINTHSEIRLWFNQQDYRQTDFTVEQTKVESTGDNDQTLYLIGRVERTGEEIRIIDWLIIEPRVDRPPGTKHWQHFTKAEKIGVRFPIWFADAQSNIYLVSELPEIPSDTRAFTVLLVNLLLIGGALHCLISPLRKAAKVAKVSPSATTSAEP